MTDLARAVDALNVLGARVEVLLNQVIAEMKDQSARLAKLEQASNRRLN